jgi:HlyD family secretion protein
MLALLRQHPFIALLSVLVIALLVAGFWPQPIVVTTVEVKHAPLTITIEEEGRTRLIDRYVIAAPIDGVTCRNNLDVGDAVSEGQVLLHISPLASQALDARSRAHAKAQIAAANSAKQAAVAQAQAAETAAQLAATELARLQKLIDKRLIAQDIFDRAQAEANSSMAALRSAKFNVNVADHELEAAQTLLQYSANTQDNLIVERIPVRSPITGKVLKVNHECESPVRTGDLLLEVGDPSALEVEVDVLSIDAVKIQPGIKVLFERWGGNGALEGIVRIVEPIAFTKVSALGVEEQRVLIIADFSSAADKWQRLGDGYRVDAQFILWQQDQILQIPTSSLFRYKDQWSVFVVDNNRAKRRLVKIGQRNGLAAQVLEGLAAGEQLIAYPDESIEEGVRIDIINITAKH